MDAYSLKKVTTFLEQDHIRKLIEQEDLETVYKEFEYESDILTRYFLECGIYPDDYMTYIPENCFTRGVAEGSYVVSGTVKSIGRWAFSACPKLVEVVIPNSVTKIAGHAFHSCGLLSLVVPKSVTVIEESAFRFCHDLKSVTFNNNVLTVEEDAFSSCAKDSILVVNFSGTKQQFKSITKGAFKDTYYIAHCIDGDIVKRRK